MERKEKKDENEFSDLYYESGNLKNEILLGYNLTEEEKRLLWLILNSPTFQLTETLRDFINQRKWGKAIFELFKIIGRLISSDNQIGFSEFSNLDVKSLNLDKKTKLQLKTLIKLLEKAINNVSDIKKKLKFTYLLSAVKNKYLERRDSIIDGEELLKKNLEIGDIVLLNKKVGVKDLGTKLLEAYDDNYDTDFGHAAIVISVDPIWVRHSTFFVPDGGKGRVYDSPLNGYLLSCYCSGYDLLSLRPPKKIKDKIMAFSEKNLGKKYDSNAAIGGGLYGKDGEGSNVILGFKRNEGERDDSYNCVEIIAQALDIDKLKDITHPNEFLEYMNIFTPVYMTTLQI